MKYIGSNEKEKNQRRIEDVKHGSTDINCELPLFSAGIRPLELDRYFMSIRNDFRRKVNQRRIQVVDIGVLISIIGFPMLGA